LSVPGISLLNPSDYQKISSCSVFHYGVAVLAGGYLS
jgi:hypothetical protein